MGKARKISVIENIMDELNEEVKSSSSADFVISDLVKENHSLEEEGRKSQNQDLESLIYFQPSKNNEAKKEEQESFSFL